MKASIPVRKILFLAANPKDTGRLRLDKEVRDIQEGLKLSPGRDNIQFHTQWATRIQDLRRSLLEHTPHIVHFSGHGAGTQGLVLEDATGHTHHIQTDTLARLFKLFPSVQCVLLNACYSQVQADAIAHHIPYVIGMNQAIGDDAAIKFAVGFYDALGYGRSLPEAYEFGMTAIEAEPTVIMRDMAAHPEAEFSAIPDPVTPVLIQSERVSTLDKPPVTLSRKAYRDRQALLNKVKNYWIKGVLERSLHNQILIELGLEERLDFADPFNMALGMVNQAQKTLAPGTQAIEIFDALGEGRSLLILGEPGSGKTITLLQLTRDLIARAEQDVNHLIPVVFNLSSWNGKQSIADWLVEELNTKYQIPKSVGKQWVAQQKLLLLLDGLDEVAADKRDECVVSLNYFQQTQGAEIVVCSRIKDYEALSNRLNVQSAIHLGLLTTGQIQRYLDSLGPQVTGLRELLATDTALQELAQTPLMLNLMVMSYEGVAITDLPKLNVVADRRQQLFNVYIQRMLKRRTACHYYSETNVNRWLIWLAQQMYEQSKTIFLIEEIQYSWLKTTAQRNAYHWVIKGGIGLVYGLVIGINYSLVSNFKAGILAGVISGIIVSLLFKIGGRPIDICVDALMFASPAVFLAGFEIPLLSLLFGILYGSGGAIAGRVAQAEVKPVETLRWSLKSYLAKGKFDWAIWIFTVFAVVVLAIFTWFYFMNTLGIILGLMIGILAFLITGFTRGVEVENKTIPNQGIFLSAIYTCPFILIGGVLGGFFYGLGENIVIRLTRVFLIGFLFGMVGGGGAGIACVKHFILRLSLWSDRKIPWNYAQFLNFAAEHILLRKVGGGYIFIHRSLMEHFAQLES